MNPRALFVVSMLALHSWTIAAEKAPASWDGQPRALKGDYQIYGGSLGDSIPPTAKDRKVSFLLTGPLGKELFDQIGPDLKLACSDAPGYRERRRGDLSCTHDDTGYRCYFGLDVLTGKSMNGSIC
jgi:hypothetical protein